MKNIKTLKTAIKAAKTHGHPLHRAVNGVVGCPVGGWPETQQALGDVVQELPHSSERRYTVRDLLEAVCTEDYAGRWAWRA